MAQPVSQGNESHRALAVVTGASSGIGATYARRLAHEGYDLLLIARRKERLEQLTEELRRDFPVHAEALVADLAREDDLVRVEARLRQEERIEFLVNNAGFGTRELFHDSNAAAQLTMHRLHVLATLQLSHAVLPAMVRRNRGAIVNVSSVAAFMQGPYNVSYCATKSWMNSFSEGLALELHLHKSDVKVQALCPGFTKTEFHAAMGVDRSFAPASWWMSSEEVVEASLAGLRRGRVIVVPGWRYKLIVAFLKLTPRAVLYAMASRAPNVRGKRPAAQT